MTEQEFIKEVSDEITVSCSLPFNLPPKEFERIIRQARKWFHRNYQYAVSEGYIIVPWNVFASEEFQKTRRVKLDDCVEGVTTIERVSDNFGGFNEGDFSANKFIFGQGQGSGIAGGGFGGGGSNATVGFFAADLFYQTLKDLIVPKVSFGFNNNTHEVTLNGEIEPVTHIFTVLHHIGNESLYDDVLFYEYVVARSKMQLGNMVSTIKGAPIGNVEIDYASFRSQGEQELQNVKERINNEDTTDYFFVQ